MKVLIGGDICPINKGEAILSEGLNPFCDDLQKIIKEHQLFIANLECPITLCEIPLEKTGPVLKANPSVMKGLSKLNINGFTLSNNHIMDYGEKGLQDTIEILKNNKIGYFGVGENSSSASEPLVFIKDNLKIAFWGITANEFSVAGEKKSGAFGIDLISITQKLKVFQSEKFDHIIVLLHAGVEGYKLPSPEQQRLCRFLIEEGCTAVICQHSHISGAYEHYKGGVISYGQGNMYFDYDNQYESEWNYGYLISLDLNDKMLKKVEIIPFKQFYKKDESVRLLNAEENSFFLSMLEKYSQLLSPVDIELQWDLYCRKREARYWAYYFGFGKFLTKLNNKIPIYKLFISEYKRRLWSNVHRCEQHSEIIHTLFGLENEKK